MKGERNWCIKRTCQRAYVIYLSMFEISSVASHTQRGKLSVRLKIRCNSTPTEKGKKELKREMVKKDSGKRCPSLFTSFHYPHIYDHFLLKKMFFYMKFWVWGNFFRTMKLTSLSGFYYFYFFLKKKYLWIDQNRGTSFDLTLSFQIIWCTSLAPFDEQQRTFEERERERTVLCWEIYKNI